MRGLGQLAGGPVVLRGQRVRLPMVQKGNASHTRDGLNGKATWGDGGEVRVDRRGLGSQQKREGCVVRGVSSRRAVFTSGALSPGSAWSMHMCSQTAR